MPDRFFIRQIVIIMLMLQTIFICSCSRTQKPDLRDYGVERAENVHFSPFCEPVPYPGENPEEDKSVFASERTARNTGNHEAENPEKDKSVFTPEVTEKPSLIKTATKPRKPPPAKPDDPRENMHCEQNAVTKDVSDGKTETPDKPSADLSDKQFYRHYSRKLGIELDGTENRKLIMAVAEWMGTPYLWGGCSPKGVDCSCLIKNIYEKVYGIELRRTSMMMCNADIVPVDEEKLREGDIICFGTKEDNISHVGLYLRDNRFVHASLSGGVRISSLERNYFKKRLIMAGRAIRPLQISIAKLSIGELVVVNR